MRFFFVCMVFAVSFSCLGSNRAPLYSAASAGLAAGGIGVLATEADLWQQGSYKLAWQKLKARGFKGNWKVFLAATLLAGSIASGLKAGRLVSHDAQVKSSEIERLKVANHRLIAQLDEVRTTARDKQIKMIHDQIELVKAASEEAEKVLDLENKALAEIQAKPAPGGAGSNTGAAETRASKLLTGHLGTLTAQLKELEAQRTSL